MQKKIIGNWKMHKTSVEAQKYIKTFLPLVTHAKADIGLAVPFTMLESLVGCGIKIGAQNMHDAEEGAFTGEISARMLKSAGATFVLLGHSERRTIFGESNAFIHKKLVRALLEGLAPVLCIGETLEEREGKKTEKVLAAQLEQCLSGLEKHALEKCTLAYEPVWAIGTGKSATPEIANDAHTFVRTFIQKTWGCTLPILYGGSVTGQNARALLSMKNIDGALVGGASLDPHSFSEIINQGVS